MKIQDILEARKNPELNPKISINAEMANYAKANKGKKCYISFTVIEKLGVNPAVSKDAKQYNTPIGVYCYPLEYAIKLMGTTNSGTALPFAGESKFANLFTTKGNIIDLANISESDVEDLDLDLSSILPDEIHSKIHDIIQSAEYDAKKATPGGKYWYVIWSCANLWSKITKARSSVLMTKIFRGLGIDGIIDRKNQGIIHHNEKTQGVIFNPTSITNVRRIYNRYSPVDIADRKNHGQKVRTLSQRVATLLKSPMSIGEKLREASAFGILPYMPQTFFDDVVPADSRVMYRTAKTDEMAMSMLLSNHVKKRLPKCEDYIKNDAELSSAYAVYFSKARFIDGEPAIKKSPAAWADYVYHFPEAAK